MLAPDFDGDVAGDGAFPLEDEAVLVDRLAADDADVGQSGRQDARVEDGACLDSLDVLCVAVALEPGDQEALHAFGLGCVLLGLRVAPKQVVHLVGVVAQVEEGVKGAGVRGEGGGVLPVAVGHHVVGLPRASVVPLGDDVAGAGGLALDQIPQALAVGRHGLDPEVIQNGGEQIQVRDWLRHGCAGLDAPRKPEH